MTLLLGPPSAAIYDIQLNQGLMQKHDLQVMYSINYFVAFGLLSIKRNKAFFYDFMFSFNNVEMS